MSLAPGMTIEENMVQVVARASLDSLAGEAVTDLNPDLSVLEAARTAKTRAGGTHADIVLPVVVLTILWPIVE